MAPVERGGERPTFTILGKIIVIYAQKLPLENFELLL